MESNDLVTKPSKEEPAEITSVVKEQGNEEKLSPAERISKEAERTLELESDLPDTGPLTKNPLGTDDPAPNTGHHKIKIEPPPERVRTNVSDVSDADLDTDDEPTQPPYPVQTSDARSDPENNTHEDTPPPDENDETVKQEPQNLDEPHCTKKRRRSRISKTAPIKNADALIRAVQKLGSKPARKIKRLWESLDTKAGGTDWEKGNGILLVLINIGLSFNEIRQLLGVGGYRLARLNNYVPSEGRVQGERSHKLGERTLELFRGFFETLETHTVAVPVDIKAESPDTDNLTVLGEMTQRIQVIEPVTWKVLHKRYEQFMAAAMENLTAEEADIIKVMKLTTFREYRVKMFPEWCLTRREDYERERKKMKGVEGTDHPLPASSPSPVSPPQPLAPPPPDSLNYTITI